MADIYIHRTVRFEDELISDERLLQEAGVILVLAEPGAGKTDFLAYLSNGLGAALMPATIFRHAAVAPGTNVLVIDALDEVARVDETGTDQMLVKARDIGAATVILSSRSYVWDEPRTKFVRDCFGIEPKIVRLEPFNEDEQKRLFEAYLPGEDFNAFRVEAERFGLAPLLGNPQFLQLFAAAFVEGGRRFTTKAQIYIDALNKLASEKKTSSAQRNRPPIETIVAHASEIFAKLLLSGAVGVSVSEQFGDNDYPYLRSLNFESPDILPFALDTGLFKPDSIEGKHIPVHRIVAEYGAARYLTARIDEAGDTLSLRRCLAIIAPNSTARDELRGMLGWMATLGSRPIQEAIIDLDPYAVLSNGDPSQLEAASKRRLLNRLQLLAETDPYFRRTDAWRRFNVAGFFSGEIIEDLRMLLSTPDARTHLRGLILELMGGSPAVPELTNELRALLLDSGASVDTRLLAHRNLIQWAEHDHIADFDALIAEGTAQSLRLASEMAATKTVAFFGRDRVQMLLRALGGIYPTDDRRERTIGSRFFIGQLVKKFEDGEVQYFLNELTRDLSCVCGATAPHRCRCRDGVSKIAGRLLDRYFEIAIGPHCPSKLWDWIKSLRFRRQVSADQSHSVQALVSDPGLRQAVQRQSLRDLRTREQLNESHGYLFYSRAHAGLQMREDDVRVIVDHAFAEGNTALWTHFFARHDPYASERGPNPLRSHMRKQSRQAQLFLGPWTQYEREIRKVMRADRRYWPRSGKYELEEAQERNAIIEHFNRNRVQIEAGQHINWLKKFAFDYLYEPDKLSDVPSSVQTAELALRNSFGPMSAHVPTLSALAKRSGAVYAQILHAACLVIFRTSGSLRDIDVTILKAVKTESGGANGYREGEEALFEAEIDRQLLPSIESVRAFAREFIEPQLSGKHNEPTLTYVFTNKSVFEPVRGELALDFLTRYPNMPMDAQIAFFGVAAKAADRTALNELIIRRCGETPSIPEANEVTAERRRFWLVRNFFFISPTASDVWTEFSADPKSIFEIEHWAGRFSREGSAGWPALSAEKVHCILDTYVDHWPKVHLPNSYGTDDPENERAYRFLTDIVSQIGRDDPSSAIPLLDSMLADPRFAEFVNEAKSLRAAAVREQALANFTPPKPREIVRLLDENKIASVEDLRALLVELFLEMQIWLRGAPTDPLQAYYTNGKHVDENTARNRIVEKLQDRLNALNLAVLVEHHMANSNRCDITASTSIDGREILLAIEVKGQWHSKLYTAASEQLADRYMIHPKAARQGVYLVLWFGSSEKIAGESTPAIASADQLRESIVASMPSQLRSSIDVVVLDLSLPTSSKIARRARKKRKPKSAKAASGRL